MAFLVVLAVSLLARNKVDEAYESLKFYRTCKNNEVSHSSVIAEFELMKSASKTKKEEELKIRDFCKN